MKRLLFLVVSSCVDEYDPEVIVVLPDVQDPCGTIGAARARVMIETDRKSVV